MKTTNAAIALVAVLALTLCGSAVLLTDSADAASGQAFTVEMGSGDLFSYTPSVPGTVSIDSGSSASVYLTVVDGTVQGTIPRSGSYQAVLNIVDGGKASVQTIDFTVKESVSSSGRPTITNVAATSMTGDLHNLVLSMTVSGATSMAISWGDSSEILSVDVRSSASGQRYSAMHNYSGADVAVIGIDASNSTGTGHAVVLLDLGNAKAAYADAVEDTKSFIEEHGWFLAFAILTIITIVVFAFVRNPLILIPAAILAILAILFYQYDDPAGIIDGLKELLGL